MSRLRIGIDRTLIAAGADADMVRATEEAAAVLAQIGALVKEVRFPSPDDVVRVAIPLCGVEAAVAHEGRARSGYTHLTASHSLMRGCSNYSGTRAGEAPSTGLIPDTLDRADA